MNGPFYQFLDSFLEYIKNEKGLSDHTIRNYSSDLLQWDNALKAIKVLKVQDVNSENIRAALNKKNKTNSLQRKLAALRSFIGYLSKEKIINETIISNIPSPKHTSELPVVLNEEDMQIFINSYSINGEEKKIRNRLIVSLLYSTGLRASEVCSLEWNDISYTNKTILVKQGKGKKDRIIPLLEMMQGQLKDFQSIKKIKSKYIFTNQRGEKISTRTLQNIVKDFLLKSQLPKNVTPHTLRHTFATHLLSNGANLRVIQEILGHSSLSTTQKYTQLDQKTLIDEYDKAHPLVKKTNYKFR